MEHVETFKKLMSGLKITLEQAGIKNVTVHYSGSGDEGVTEPVEFDPKPATLPLEADVVDSIEDAFVSLIESHCGNYEDGDGGGGDFSYEVSTGKLSHTSYYVGEIPNPNEEL
jgi:hypothetical protein